MPLQHGAKPGSPGFSRNVAAEVHAGKPQKQAVAIAYRESGERSHDAMPSSVRILGGSDPTGPQELVPVPRHSPATPAGTVMNVGFPSTEALGEPYPWANLPPTTQSKSVHPQPRVAIPVVGGEEVAVKDDAPDGMEPMGDDLFGLMAPVNHALESAQKPSTPPPADNPPSNPPPSSSPSPAPSSGSETKDDEYGGGAPEGEVPQNAGMSGAIGMASSEVGDVGAMSIVNGKKTGYEIDTDDCNLTPVGRDSFKEVEEHAAKEYGSEEAGKRVAAAVGFAKYGKKGMERKAEAGKK